MGYTERQFAVEQAVECRIGQLRFEEANRAVLTEIFGRLDAQAALPALSKIMTDWRPDLVVRESCEFGSLVAADAAAIVQLEVAIGMGGSAPELSASSRSH